MTSHNRLQTPQEIEQHANQIVGDFLQYITSNKHPLTEWVFSQATEPLQSRREGGIGRPIRAVTKKSVLELQICPEDLLGITYIALQGWLELEITRSTEEAKADSCQFNFQNQIRPLMYLAGSGLYFVRELVEHLSRSLIRRETTKMIHQMGRGLPQVYYYFHTLNFSEEEKKFYTNFPLTNGHEPAIYAANWSSIWAYPIWPIMASASPKRCAWNGRSNMDTFQKTRPSWTK